MRHALMAQHDLVWCYRPKRGKYRRRTVYRQPNRRRATAGAGFVIEAAAAYIRRMPRHNSKIEGEADRPYSVHEQHAVELGRHLLGPPVSLHHTIGAAIEDARARRKVQDKTFVVCNEANLVIWAQ
jgi:hypothetical protein